MKNIRKKPAMDSEVLKPSDQHEEQAKAEEKNEEEGPKAQIQKRPPQEEEAPTLDEGFYEIEAIRRKRVHKNQLQYLIKWRGWRESANTWEPFENLQGCSEIIDAFEERLLKPTRKRKRKSGGPYSAASKNRRPSSSERDTNVSSSLLSEPTAEDLDLDRLDSIGGEDAEVKGSEAGDVVMKEEDVQANGSLVNESKGDEERKEGEGGYILIQLNGDGLREEEGLVESAQPLQGAKKRKSGCVKRFKAADDVLPSQENGDGDKGEKLGTEDVDSTEDDNGEKQKLEEDGRPPYVMKILSAVEFHTSVTNNVQQVSVKFKALRSDGQEVFVDNKELKLNNPSLLISYYEQNLRYSPPACDVNEQQS